MDKYSDNKQRKHSGLKQDCWFLSPVARQIKKRNNKNIESVYLCKNTIINSKLKGCNDTF